MTANIETRTRAISAHNLFRGPDYIFGKPVALEIIFSNHKGVYKKRIEKRQRRRLTKIPFINSFLEDGEKIVLVTSGYAPLTRLERFLLRYLTVFLRRALFVFTDRRMLYIPTTFSYDYRQSVAEIRYVNCDAIHVAGRSLVFVFHNGQYEHFHYIGRSECRKLQAIADNLFLGEGPAGTEGMTHLCARCHVAVPDSSASCPQCRLQFKTAGKAGKMALLSPGGGYFYIGNTLYGVATAILELLFAVLLAIAAMDVNQGLKGSVLALIVLIMVLSAVKTVSFFHPRELVQGCFPAKGQLSPVKS